MRHWSLPFQPATGTLPIDPHSAPSQGRRTLPGMGVLIMLLALLCALAPLRELAVVLGAGAAFLLLVRRPWLVWLPVAALLPVAASYKVGPASGADLLFAAGVALWFVDGARRRTLRLHGGLVPALVLLWVGAQFLSTLAAQDFAEAAAEVIKWLELLVILLLVPAMVPPGRVLWIAAALVAGGVGQALLGLYQFYFQVGPDWFVLFDRYMRAYGSFGQPNPFAGYLGLTLPVALSMSLWALGEWWRQDGERQAALWWGSFFGVATLMITAGLLASWSRGAWVGAAAGLMVVVALRSRRTAAAVGVLLVAGLFAGLFGSFRPDLVPAPLASRVADLPAYFGLADVLNQPVTDENFAVIERVAHWYAAGKMWELSPWVGVGPGNYAITYPQVRLPRWEEPLGHAHNIYLNVLAETGLVGLLFFLLFWLVSLGWIWRTAHACRSDRRGSALALGVLGIFVHATVHHLFDSLFVQGMVLHLGMWLAITVLIGRQNKLWTGTMTGIDEES
jgi:putative inorganic carbon (hco3(-)) transporter